MKKKIVTLLLAGALAASLAACGSSSGDTDDQNAEVSATEETEETTETETVEEETAEEESTVTEENGMRKEVLYTNEDLGITGTTGPINYTISGIQVSNLTATTDEAAEMLGIEKDTEVALVVIEASGENTTDDTIYFYLGQATLVSNTKEQIDPDIWYSDYIDGEYLGNVIHSGQLMYILPNSVGDDITDVTLYVNAPSDADWDTVGEDVVIEIAIE